MLMKGSVFFQKINWPWLHEIILGTRTSFDDLTLQKRSEIEFQIKGRNLRAVSDGDNRDEKKTTDFYILRNPLLHIHQSSVM